MKKETYRGNEICIVKGISYYSDTKEPVAETHTTKPCGNCGKGYTKEGHDGCIGTLPNVMNACCGHGITADAYIQYWDRIRVGGQEALDEMEKLKNGKK